MTEADSLKAVNVDGGHPNVLKLIGVALQASPPLILVEFAEHGNLKSYLILHAQSRLEESVLVKFCLDIARGMAFLSENHVVHRGLLLVEHRFVACFVFDRNNVQILRVETAL